MEEFTQGQYVGFAGQTPNGPRMVMTGVGGYLLPDAPGDNTQAALFFQSGRCQEAVAMARRALDMLHERAPDTARQEFKRLITVYETRCAPASASAKPE